MILYTNFTPTHVCMNWANERELRWSWWRFAPQLLARAKFKERLQAEWTCDPSSLCVDFQASYVCNKNVNSALWSAGIKSYSYIQGSVVDSCWNFYRVGQVNGNIFGSDESFLFWERKGEVSRLDLARESIVI